MIQRRILTSMASMFVRKLGIDIGSSYTRIYIPQKGIVLEEPTLVALSKTTQEVVAIGKDAEVMQGKNPDAIEVYAPVSGGLPIHLPLLEVMIREYIHSVISTYSFVKPEVVLSIPTDISSTEKRALVESILKAHVKAVYVVKQPVLAAYGAMINTDHAKGSMMVTIGGGTTDIAITSLGSTVSGKSLKLGGRDIDKKIKEYIATNKNLEVSEKNAEDIKIAIASALYEEDEEYVVEVRGRDMFSGLPASFDITSNEIYPIIKEFLEEVCEGIRVVLSMTPPEIVVDIMDQGIHLAGGSAQISNITEFIFRKTGVRSRLVQDPSHVVILGTDKALTKLQDYKDADKITR